MAEKVITETLFDFCAKKNASTISKRIKNKKDRKNERKREKVNRTQVFNVCFSEKANLHTFNIRLVQK